MYYLGQAHTNLDESVLVSRSTSASSDAARLAVFGSACHRSTSGARGTLILDQASADIREQSGRRARRGWMRRVEKARNQKVRNQICARICARDASGRLETGETHRIGEDMRRPIGRGQRGD